MNISFETERLIARVPVSADAPRITELFQEKALAWNLGRAPWPYALSDAHNWIDNLAKTRAAGTEYGVVLDHADHGLIGSVGMLHVQDDIWECGYWVGKPYWGNRFAGEATRGLFDWAEVKLGITRYISGHIIDNEASGRVLERLGFVKVGTTTHYVRGRDCNVEAARYVRNAPAEIALLPFKH